MRNVPSLVPMTRFVFAHESPQMTSCLKLGKTQVGSQGPRWEGRGWSRPEGTSPLRIDSSLSVWPYLTNASLGKKMRFQLRKCMLFLFELVCNCFAYSKDTVISDGSKGLETLHILLLCDLDPLKDKEVLPLPPPRKWRSMSSREINLFQANEQ